MGVGAGGIAEQRRLVLRAMDIDLQYVGRDASASPATGSHQVHVREQRELVEAALAGKAPHIVRATTLVQHARRAAEAPKESRPAQVRT